MKKFLFTPLILSVLISSAYANPINDDCTYNGIPLYGSVKIVDSFADITVRKVDGFADLKVQFVDSFASSCGQWRIVSGGEDFTVRIVDSFADITIKEVDSFPGLY